MPPAVTVSLLFTGTPPIVALLASVAPGEPLTLGSAADPALAAAGALLVQLRR